MSAFGLAGSAASRAEAQDASSLATTQTSIRVLLFEADDSVRIRTPNTARWTEITAVEGGVRVAGQSAGPTAVWRSQGPGPVWVDQLEVRGVVEVSRTASGLAVVNEVPLESYLAGSLGREMYAGWDGAALRAQAVASRSYALHRMRPAGNNGTTGKSGSSGGSEASRVPHFDLTSDTSSQVYRGVSAESPAVWAALEATRGQILVHSGAPILAAFHSASGGVTASSREVWGESHPYLISQPVEGEEDSPDTYWRAAISRTTLTRAAAGLGLPIGEIRELRIVARGPSGRVARLRATGARGTVEFTGRELRRVLGEFILRSTLFEIRRSEDGFVFVGSGRGHGVGMSQWGARALAEQGETYEQILRIFYPGAQLRPGGNLAAASEREALAFAARGAR